MSQPLVSVVIPVHNVANFLRECLDSILNQTISDIEVICVNDASTDSSGQILQEYQAKDNRFILIEHKTAQGPSITRNRGTQLATGKYLLFVDADDVIDRSLLQKTIDLAQNNNADLVLFDFTTFTKDCNKTPPFSPRKNIQLNNKLSLLTFPAFVWAKLIKTEYYKQQQIEFPPGLNFEEDTLVHWKLILDTNQIVLLSEPLYFYRQRPTSIVGRGGLRHIDKIEVYNILNSWLKQRNDYSLYRSLFLKKKLSVYPTVYWNVPRKNRPEVLQRIRELFNEDDDLFLKENVSQLSRPVQWFYAMCHGSFWAKLKFHSYILLRNIGHCTKAIISHCK